MKNVPSLLLGLTVTAPNTTEANITLHFIFEVA